MRRLAPLLVLLALAACAAPREACEDRVGVEIRRLNALIAETRADLARGYRTERDYRDGFGVGLTLCSGGRDVRFCTGSGTRYRIDREAVDPEAERRKLDALEARRTRLALRGEEACRARYPQG
jgi:hypothetical protein